MIGGTLYIIVYVIWFLNHITCLKDLMGTGMATLLSISVIAMKIAFTVTDDAAGKDLGIIP
jgi:hypothetical protein